MKHKDLKREIAVKHGFNEEIVDRIVKYPFKFVNKTMRKGNFDKVLINGFGSFSSDEYRRKKINEKGKRDML
jgi:nucleoid DNA-binding protein